MSSVRWKSGQVQAAIAKHLEDGLTSLGWMDVPPRWTSTPFRWDPDFDAEAFAEGTDMPTPNVVGLSLGNIPDVEPEELGDGLRSIDFPVFVDIYTESRGISLNLSDDIQAILAGELWTTSRYIPLYDQTQQPPTLMTDNALEARTVMARWPEGADRYKRRWRIVNFTARYYWVPS